MSVNYKLQRYSKKTTLERIVWNLLWTLTIRPFPRNMMKKWEIFVLRCLGAKIGKGCNIYGSTEIFLPRNLIMEDGSSIADHVLITNSHVLHLKKYAVLSQYSVVMNGTHNVYSDEFESEMKPIVLEENCWVASHSYLCGGVTVGRGSRVGAKSIVRTNIPPYAIAYGNPVKIVGFRYTPEEMEAKESILYPKEERTDSVQYEKLYDKYFINRIREIKEYTRL